MIRSIRNPAPTRSGPALAGRVGKLAFCFFFLKGLAWLAAPMIYLLVG